MQLRYAQMTTFLLVSLVAGCAGLARTSAPPNNIKLNDSGFIYGYVEATNDAIDRVTLVEYGRIYIPPFTQPPRVLVYNNGVFMAENIKPGRYVISGFRSSRNNYNLARSKRDAYQKIFRVMPGEMQYVGAFNVKVTKKGDLRFGKFKITELQRPGERDVLKELYHATEGTAWQDKIARRLKQLRQL